MGGKMNGVPLMNGVANVDGQRHPVDHRTPVDWLEPLLERATTEEIKRAALRVVDGSEGRSYAAVAREMGVSRVAMFKAVRTIHEKTGVPMPTLKAKGGGRKPGGEKQDPAPGPKPGRGPTHHAPNNGKAHQLP